MKKFEKIFFSMIAMIMMVAVGSVFTSCTNDDDDFRVPAQETQLDQALSQDSVAPMTRSVYLPNFGTDVQGWTRIKTGNNVVIYKKNNSNYKYIIADVDLSNANIGLLFGDNYIPTSVENWQILGCHYFQKYYVSSLAQNVSDCFFAVNFGLFHNSNDNSTWDPSCYPFKQGSFNDIGASLTSSYDYTGYSLYTMVFNQNVGVRLDNFTASNWSNFSNTYGSTSKAYVVRNDVGNSPNSYVRRTILAFTTLSSGYFRRMYVFITNDSIKEGDTNNLDSGTAKKYIKDFIEAQQQACVSIVYCPLDGGSSSQLYIKGDSQNSFTSSRKVINALIVKD